MFRSFTKILSKGSPVSRRAICFGPEAKLEFVIGGKACKPFLNDAEAASYKQMIELYTNEQSVYQELVKLVKGQDVELSGRAKVFLDQVPLVHWHGVKEHKMIKQFLSIPEKMGEPLHLKMYGR